MSKFQVGDIIAEGGDNDIDRYMYIIGYYYNWGEEYLFINAYNEMDKSFTLPVIYVDQYYELITDIFRE